EDPASLRMRVAQPFDGSGARDPALQPLVLTSQLGVAAEGVTERDVAREIATFRLDVEMDAVLLAVELIRADRHRPRRRPGVGAGLRPETEVVQHLDDARDVLRRGLDR